MNTEELSLSEIGVRVDPPKAKILVVLSAKELADAIAKAHGVKTDPSDFALKSAKMILEILPPLYYQPRNES